MSTKWICFGAFRAKIGQSGNWWHYGRLAYGKTPFAAFHELVKANCLYGVELTGKPRCRRVL